MSRWEVLFIGGMALVGTLLFSTWATFALLAAAEDVDIEPTLRAVR